MMDELPNIIQKSIVKVLNRLENDEDNRFSWKLSRKKDRQLQPSRQKSKQRRGRQRGHRTCYFETSKRRRKKKKSPSVLARSRKRCERFLGKNLAGKPGLASLEGKSVTAIPSEQDTDNSLCTKELEK